MWPSPLGVSVAETTSTSICTSTVHLGFLSDGQDKDRQEDALVQRYQLFHTDSKHPGCPPVGSGMARQGSARGEWCVAAVVSPLRVCTRKSFDVLLSAANNSPCKAYHDTRAMHSECS